MDSEIGAAAGAAWRHLSEHGATTAARLRDMLDLPDATLYLALGWLAREGKVSLTRDKRSLKVALREG